MLTATLCAAAADSVRAMPFHDCQARHMAPGLVPSRTLCMRPARLWLWRRASATTLRTVRSGHAGVLCVEGAEIPRCRLTRRCCVQGPCRRPNAPWTQCAQFDNPFTQTCPPGLQVRPLHDLYCLILSVGGLLLTLHPMWPAAGLPRGYFPDTMHS